MEGGAILLQLTEDGKLILPPGLAAAIQPQNQPQSQTSELTTLSAAQPL